MKDTEATVCASVVIYNPDPGHLDWLIVTVRPQVGLLAIVDNGSSEEQRRTLRELHKGGIAVYLPQGANVGVSAGHNAAAKLAREQRCTHLLMLDQDSRPAPDMVAKLLRADSALRRRGGVAAALGPVFLDPRDGSTAPFIRLENWRIRKLYCAGSGDMTIAADYLITSGALLSLEVFDRVGGLDEAMFIDYVDIEWGLRAKARGYQSYGVCDARMEHPIGDNPLRLPIINLRVPLHSPLRHYYHYRNAVLLYRREYTPLKWALNDACRMAAKFLVYVLFTGQPWRHCRMMLLGLWHGLIGRAGPLKPESRHDA